MAIYTTRLIARVSPELARKIDRQARRENRTKADFVRRVLERYIEDKEFTETTSQKTTRSAQSAATESMAKNTELLDKLADS
jgi:predicted DNA-binding protein